MDKTDQTLKTLTLNIDKITKHHDIIIFITCVNTFKIRID